MAAGTFFSVRVVGEKALPAGLELPGFEATLEPGDRRTVVEAIPVEAVTAPPARPRDRGEPARRALPRRSGVAGRRATARTQTVPAPASSRVRVHAATQPVRVALPSLKAPAAAKPQAPAASGPAETSVSLSAAPAGKPAEETKSVEEQVAPKLDAAMKRADARRKADAPEPARGGGNRSSSPRSGDDSEDRDHGREQKGNRDDRPALESRTMEPDDGGGEDKPHGRDRSDADGDGEKKEKKEKD